MIVFPWLVHVWGEGGNCVPFSRQGANSDVHAVYRLEKVA